jgi:hypothetical protein
MIWETETSLVTAKKDTWRTLSIEDRILQKLQ